MQSPLFDSETIGQIDLETTQARNKVLFQGKFSGYMEMYSDIDTVAQYLQAHQGWFARCASPMKVEALNENAYILTVGRFGSYGYEVEPKIAVVLHPPIDRLYLMNTIDVPDYQPPGYEVNYQAAMELKEVPINLAMSDVMGAFKKNKSSLIPDSITQVYWQLDLSVRVQFPQFIYKLPLSLIQTTGDGALAQIVYQISPRLTYKVQQDFHSLQNIPLPSKQGRKCEKITLN